MKPLLYRQITGLSTAKKLGVGHSVLTGVTITAAGSGYVLGNTFNLPGGTALKTASLRVVAVTPTGGVTRLEILSGGVYTAKPTDPVSVSYALGSGLTFTTAWHDDSAPGGTVRALVIPETQAVRWRDDGDAPLAAVGMTLAVGQTLEVQGGSIDAIRFIEVTAGAVLNVTFYGN